MTRGNIRLTAAAAIVIIGFSSIATAADTPADARKEMEGFCACLMKRSGFSLRRAMELPVNSRQTIETFVELADSDCLPSGPDKSLTFKPSLMRGQIFQLMYKADFLKIAPPTGFVEVKPVKYALSSTGKADLPKPPEEDVQRYLVEVYIGDCLVRAQPLLSRQLVLTRVETPEETAAIQALVPALGACTPEGQAIKVSKSNIQAMVAEPLYRLTKAYTEMPHA